MIPVIPVIFHIHILSGSFDRNADFHGGRQFHGLVDNAFQFYDFTPPVSSVCSDHYPAVCIVDSVSKGFVTESAVNHTMRCPDFCTGKHGKYLLRNLGHIDGNHISLFYPHAFQHIGELAYLPVQGMIGKSTHITGFTLPNQCQFVSCCRFLVTVERIIDNVCFAAGEPFVKGGLELSSTLSHF